jgi:hypothetical protein
MPLHWDVSKVKDADTLCWRTATVDNRNTGEVAGEKYLAVPTHVLVFALGWAGVGSSITDENVEELVLRVAFYQQLRGPLMRRGDGKDWPLTAAEVRAHVGLYTSWGMKLETRKAWLARMGESWMQDQERHQRYQLEQAKREQQPV